MYLVRLSDVFAETPLLAHHICLARSLHNPALQVIDQAEGNSQAQETSTESNTPALSLEEDTALFVHHRLSLPLLILTCHVTD